VHCICHLTWERTEKRKEETAARPQKPYFAGREQDCLEKPVGSPQQEEGTDAITSERKKLKREKAADHRTGLHWKTPGEKGKKKN